MAVRHILATPGWICVLNNYHNNVYIIIHTKAYMDIHIGLGIIYECVELQL